MMRSLAATSPLGLVMLAFILCCTALGVTLILPVFRAWTAPAPKMDYQPLSADERNKRIALADSMLRSSVDRVVDRSPFYPKKPPVVDKPRNTPRTYGGPALVAMMGDSAWFSGGQRLIVGEHASDSDIELISISPPWTAQVRWMGAEFTVTLFDRNADILNSSEPLHNTLFPATTKPTDRDRFSPSGRRDRQPRPAGGPSSATGDRFRFQSPAGTGPDSTSSSPSRRPASPSTPESPATSNPPAPPPADSPNEQPSSPAPSAPPAQPSDPHPAEPKPLEPAQPLSPGSSSPAPTPIAPPPPPAPPAGETPKVIIL